jgi:F0F1-type ATP synthase membrane subunit c/vacuolar-type H+-ATPase subunit K
MRIFKQCVLFIFFLLLFLSFNSFSFAQSSPTTTSVADVKGTATLGVAKIVEISGDVKDGSIISAAQKKSALADTPYDSQVIGVVSRDAAIVLNATGTQKGVPVISMGTVYVLVTTKNGVIKKGDYVTTSLIKGVGMKADKDGYVIGRALEDDINPNTKQIDKIAVDLELHYFNTRPSLLGSLTDILKLAFLPTKEGPTAIFKYIVAAGVVVASFVLGFLSFGRTAAKGVEALGRNPSASKIINLGIIFNVSIVVVIVLAGLFVAFLILRL